MLELLEQGHIHDYIDQRSRSGREKSKGRRSGNHSHMGVVTWTSLFWSVQVFIQKEAEAIQKLEEKGSTASISLTNRFTKKKVITHCVPVSYHVLKSPKDKKP